MNILRWFMQHPILLAWALAAIAILLNFGVGGSGSDDHAKQASAEHAEQADTAAHTGDQQQAGTETHGGADTAVGGQAEQQQNTAVTANEATQQETATAQSGTDGDQAPVAAQQAEDAVQTAANNATDAANAMASAGQQAASAVADAGQAATQTVANAAQAVAGGMAQPVETAATASSPDELLRAAREAYWSNELEAAADFYGQLVQQVPDSLDYKGELANVYWKQGNAQEAANLFAEIAPKLAEQGRVTEAFNMKLYVEMVNPELAQSIDAALSK